MGPQGRNRICQFWNAFLFVDGRTENFHTEHDCAYTLITVPKQHMKKDIQISERPYFIFKIDEDEISEDLRT